jgi:hypothetical protein
MHRKLSGFKSFSGIFTPADYRALSLRTGGILGPDHLELSDLRPVQCALPGGHQFSRIYPLDA